MQGSKQTLRQHNEQIEKTLGRKPKGWVEPMRCPEAMEGIWQMYQRLSPAAPLSYSELKCWSELTATPLRPVEAESLIHLDRLYWSTVNGK